jgi:5-(carboxyamino)imidazole ribonucleotide synthase
VIISFLDPDPECSCKRAGADVVQGSLLDAEAIVAFAQDKDILTVEIEHVSIAGLEQARDKGVAVYPSPEMLALIQDKGAQKEFYRSQNIPTAPYALLESGFDSLLEDWTVPFVLKSRRGGYDGKGVMVVQSDSPTEDRFSEPSLVEELADIRKEISVIVARSPKGEIKAFPPVEMEFDPRANLVSALISPADLSADIVSKAIAMACDVAEKLDLTGILAVEMFWLKSGELWVNEVAPRPHNSGHQTIEGNKTSQYQQHLNAILDFKLGSTAETSISVMVNLLGREGHDGPVLIRNANEFKGNPQVFIHDYLKAITRPFRKMGHATILGKTRKSALEEALYVQKTIRYEAEE